MKNNEKLIAKAKKEIPLLKQDFGSMELEIQNKKE